MQVWRSALLMSDFIMENQDIFTNDQVVMELGSGVGLTGIVAAMYCKEVIFTGEPFILTYYNIGIIKQFVYIMNRIYISIRCGMHLS